MARCCGAIVLVLLEEDLKGYVLWCRLIRCKTDPAADVTSSKLGMLG